MKMARASLTLIMAALVAAPGTPAAAAAGWQLVVSVAPDQSHVRSGSTVVYTYDVSIAVFDDGPAPPPLTNVVVADDHCPAVAFVTGDTDGDGALDSAETWTYTCTSTLATTTTSTATAGALAAGSPVSATATVLVEVGPTPVFLVDQIAPLVVRGNGGLGAASVIVPSGLFVTYQVRTDPVIAGEPIEIWSRTRDGEWRHATTRLTAADGTARYYARLTEWTAFWAKLGSTDEHGAASSHGRIATTAHGHIALKVLPAEDPAPLRTAIPGERSTFLVRALDNLPSAGRVTLSATAPGASVSVEPAHPRAGEVAEVTIIPNATTTEKSLTVTFRATRGTETWTTKRSLPVVPGTDGRRQAAAEHLALFIPWLVAKHPELGISGGTRWQPTISGARLLIVDHYRYVSSEWEVGLSWHVMIPPYDWTEIYLRRRWSEDAPSLAFRIDSVRGATEPHPVPPPEQVMR
jgi:hypothetical protein